MKLKTRLIISATIGLIALLIFNFFLAEVKNSDVITFSTMQNVLWKVIPDLEVFLVPAVLCMIVISLPALFNKNKYKRVIISIVLGIALIWGIFQLESKLNQKRLAYKTLDKVQIMALYEKVMEKEKIEDVLKIMEHPNFPDSILEKLSNSELTEIRKIVAYETDSEEILKKLSLDKQWEVRLAVATNKLTPIETMNKLQIDTNEEVRNIANSMVQQRK